MVKKTASKKSDEVTTEAPPAPEVVVAPKTEEQSDETIENTFKQLYDKINTLKSELSKLSSDIKDVHKQVAKSMKENAKSRKKKADRPKREPSGFAKPTPISQELCDFLSKPLGTEMARTEVTKYLTSYIKEHDLQYPDDKRKIKPDAKLKKLLNLKKDDQVTYFNLQKYMKPHFESSKSAPAPQ
jgi:upstream activation factor subunit UAF30